VDAYSRSGRRRCSRLLFPGELPLARGGTNTFPDGEVGGDIAAHGQVVKGKRGNAPPSGSLGRSSSGAPIHSSRTARLAGTSNSLFFSPRHTTGRVLKASGIRHQDSWRLSKT
jgi:hypothetical protein